MGIKEKPRLSFGQILNMSLGFFGIQFGWSLQMANMSPIYNYLGASDGEIPLLWLAAPLTGLLIQPIIGYMSDRTWTRLGRRRPYFLVGALLSSGALILMPNSSALWMAAGLLWIMDASINISMEPFRAFVADMLPEDQRNQGFAMQSVFIGLGSVVAFLLPLFLTSYIGIKAEDGYIGIPPQVMISFYVGSAVFLGAVLWTVFSTKEYPPEDIEAFEKEKAESSGFFNGVSEVFKSISQMPRTMRKLAWVQFFTWLALFFMWIFFTRAITGSIFEAKDYPATYSFAYSASAKAEKGGKTITDYLEPGQITAINKEHGDFAKLKTALAREFGSFTAFHSTFKENLIKKSDAVNWGGACFAFYSFITFLVAFLLPGLAKRYSRRWTHLGCLVLGGLGLISIFFIKDQYLLFLSMTGVGIAWASILSMPYAMLAGCLPEDKMGIYMGIFNFFIVLPQIIASLGFGWVLNNMLDGNVMMAMLLGGIFMIVAGILNLRITAEESG